jgi:aldose 1-epimerase
VEYTSQRVISADASIEAEFVAEAGMVCCSLTHLDEQLLDTGKGLDAYAQRGSTIGIPLLYPWANRLDAFGYSVAGKSVTLPNDRSRIPLDPNGLPIHGLIPGRMRWVPDVRDDDSGLAARLTWNSPELLELFPFEHEVRVEIAAAAGTLTIATIVRGLGEDPVPISFGYHPYLRIPGTSRTSWHVELPNGRRLVLDERMIPTGQREPEQVHAFELLDSGWDDGFELASQPARFLAVTADRGVAVELLEGFPYAQLYAPPGHDYICFEPMTSPANALRSGDGLSLLEPGQAYRAVFRISAWRP